MQMRLSSAFLLVAALANAPVLGATQGAPAALPSAPIANPSEQHIATARRQLAADPRHTQTYTDLALACIRQARDTEDPAWLTEAEKTIADGQRVAPGDFQLQKAAVALLLGRQQWQEALGAAHVLHAKDPDDVTIYGYIAEADIALGNYEDADTSAQWMLNMRPNNVPGLLLGAELRGLYGDVPGALEFLGQAYAETPQVEPEELVSIANRMAELELSAGQLETAAKSVARAEELSPASMRTRELRVRLCLAQHKPEEAIALLSKLSSTQASRPGTVFLLAQAQKQAGNAEAARTFTRFAETALAAAGKPGHDTDTDELIRLDAGLPGGSPRNAAQALTLAQQAIAARHDVQTLDAFAWALYANGQYPEAEVQMQKALAVGVRSAQLDEHAGEIALKQGNASEAARLFAQAIQIAPGSPDAAQAAARLGGQQPPAAPSVFAKSNDPFQAEVSALTSAPRVHRSPAPAAPLVLAKDAGGVPKALLIPKPTSTNRNIKKMQSLVAARPQDPAGYSGLGEAFFQRARETGDVEDYNLAEQALQKSLDLVSTDLSAALPLATMAQVCMGEHRFDDALAYAQRSLSLGSGDLSAFAIVGDAYADMGEYEKAGIAYGRLQPASAAAQPQASYAQQTREAYLTFLTGDTEGAIVEMEAAVNEGLEARLPGENLAWLYFELGEFSYQGGRIQQAADAYLTALTAYPGDYRALAGLGKVRASQGRFDDAITLYQSAIAVVPMPIYIAELGDIYAKTGKPAEAEKQYKLVEYIGRLGHINQVLHNRDLALFYADHDRNLPEALALAHKEFEVRSDIYTWDALAWALYKNGQYPDAGQAMAHASRLGTRDPLLLFHAGMIAAKLQQPADAARQLQEAIAINPRFSVLYADQAEHQLEAMHARSVTETGTHTQALKVEVKAR